MNIRLPVRERREEKAEHGHLHTEVPRFIHKGLIQRVKTQALLHLRNRADAADKERIYIIRRILHHEAVRCFLRNIIISMCQKHQMPARIIQLVQNTGAEIMNHLPVVQPGLEEGVHRRLSSAGFLLLERKFQIKQIFPLLSGEHLPEQFTVFCLFLVRQRQKRLVQIQNNLPILAGKAAANFVDDTPPSAENPADLRNFLLIHNNNSFLPDVFHSTKPPGPVRFWRLRAVGTLVSALQGIRFSFSGTAPFTDWEPKSVPVETAPAMTADPSG